MWSNKNWGHHQFFFFVLFSFCCQLVLALYIMEFLKEFSKRMSGWYIILIKKQKEEKKREYFFYFLQKKKIKRNRIPLYVQKPHSPWGGRHGIHQFFVLHSFTIHFSFHLHHKSFGFSINIPPKQFQNSVQWSNLFQIAMNSVVYITISILQLVLSITHLNYCVKFIFPELWNLYINLEMIFRLWCKAILVSSLSGNRLAIYLDSIDNFVVPVWHLPA